MNCKEKDCCSIDFNIEFEELDFSVGMCYTVITGDRYMGEYSVIPKTIIQYLYTKDKVMSNDVTVYEIPYHETANEYGTTVSIASQEEI